MDDHLRIQEPIPRVQFNSCKVSLIILEALSSTLREIESYPKPIPSTLFSGLDRLSPTGKARGWIARNIIEAWLLLRAQQPQRSVMVGLYKPKDLKATYSATRKVSCPCLAQVQLISCYQALSRTGQSLTHRLVQLCIAELSIEAFA